MHIQYIEVYSYVSGKEEFVGRVDLIDDKITMYLPELLADDLRRGLNFQDRVVTPQDGITFLQAIEQELNRSLIKTSTIKEIKDMQ